MRAVLLICAAFAVLFSSTAVAAPILFGTTGDALVGDSTLVQLDPATGALIQTIGSVGYIVNGLTYDPTTNTLFASTSVNDPNHVGLISINMATGAGTPIGAAGWGNGSISPVVTITNTAAGQLYGWSGPRRQLVSINKATGSAALVGPSGITAATHGLSFDNNGVLYLVNAGGPYYTINTSSGAATLLGTIDTTAHHGDFHPDSNLYYGIDLNNPGPKNLVVANLATGTVVDILPTVDDLHTLTFVQAVPEPTTFGLFAAGMALLIIGRRRRSRS